MFQITHLLHVAKLGKNVLPILLTLYTYIVILHSTVCECNQIKKKQTNTKQNSATLDYSQITELLDVFVIHVQEHTRQIPEFISNFTQPIRAKYVFIKKKLQSDERAMVNLSLCMYNHYFKFYTLIFTSWLQAVLKYE